MKQTFKYDSYGNVLTTRIGDSNWFEIKTTYSHYGNYVDKVVDEFDNIIDYNYNPITGLLQSVIDPKGNTTHYNYDAIGRLIEVVKGNASATYIYEQNLLKEIQVNGYTIRLNYDQYNRISSINIGNFRLAQYRYETELDQYGNLIETNKLKEQIYGNGDKIKFEYDDEDRIKAVFVNSSTIPRYEYEYDSLGNIAVYIDHWNSKTYFYNYDLVGRLLTITDEQNNSISYEYDKDLGHLNLLTYNLNHIIRSIHYDYNLDTGQYDQTSYNVNGTNVIKDYTYDSLGRLEQTITNYGSTEIDRTVYEFFGGSEVKNGNSSTRIKKITVNGRSYEFTYDKNGNITRINDSKRGIIQYKYDVLNQLIREDNPVANRTYVYKYDNNGNITRYESYQYTLNDNITTSVIDWIDYYYYYDTEWTDVLTVFSGRLHGQYIYQEYYYDNQGNPKTGLGEYNRDYVWEGRQLVQINSNIFYKYNDAGIRTEKVVNGVKTEYFVVGNRVVYEKKGNEVIYYTYDVDGTVISFNYNGNEYFYTQNIFGDIIEIKDEYGMVLVEYEYDAWGNIIYIKDDSGSLQLSKVNPYRYRGYRYDEETSLY